MWLEGVLHRGWIPDRVLRMGIRRALRQRLRRERTRGSDVRESLLRDLGRGPVAHSTDEANEQHYELPADFYRAVLGPFMKYSSGYWEDPADSLAESEIRMLEITASRAGIAEGQRILDLGCGWGSFSLYAAERFPGAEIVAVSNSSSQIELIREEARMRGLENLRATRRDVNELQPEGSFDRIVSVEMFEHMNNLRLLLERISGWLAPGGRLFVHHFAHRELLYRYVADNDGEWMARHFFTGGIMPSVDLLSRFPDHMRVIGEWEISGRHYRRTCEAWLGSMSTNRDTVIGSLARAYGPEHAEERWHMWRTFFMACAELFGYDGGEQWLVSHRLLARTADVAGVAA